MLERLFHLSENGTTVRREILGGCTTFLAMSYIIFVQPVMLARAGMDAGAVMAATCVASALCSFLMAFIANYPIAMAPGMGENVFFTFTICVTMGIPWPTALGAVFISGVLMVLLTWIGFRKMVMGIIPDSLKFGIAVGIGLMIALLGFQWAGVVVKNEDTLIAVGSMTKPYVIISGAGLLVAFVFTCYRIRGSILIGSLVSAALAIHYGLIHFKGVFASPPSMTPVLFKLNPWAALSSGYITVIFILFMLDLFDSIGTLVGVAELGGFMRNGELPRAPKALLADALATIVGAVCGNSTVVSYVESCAGIGDGARTGLAAVMTGILFLLALFFAPLAAMLGQGIPTGGGALVHPVIAPALIMVGFMMMRAVKFIPWDEPTEGIPAFLTVLLIAFSFSITEGIAFGFMSYTILKLLTGRFREIHPFLLVVSLLFAIRYFYVAL